MILYDLISIMLGDLDSLIVGASYILAIYSLIYIFKSPCMIDSKCI